jgi:cobalt-zinc-cadmium efflux system protein
MAHAHVHTDDEEHNHGHHHHPPDLSGGDWRLIAAVLANIVLTFAQIIGGLLAGSLALVADALHNLNDAASIGVAYIARRIARRPADPQRTFGYRRAEVIGGLLNLTTLLVVGVYLIYKAVERFFDPQPVQGWTVVILAGLALAVDIVTAMLTYALSKESLNVKAAFIHNVSDALASVGVIVAGTLIILYEWYWADLVATLLISGYVINQGVRLLPRAVGILMEGTPPGLELAEVAKAMEEVDGVDDAHHLHAWELGEKHRALEAHVSVSTDDLLTLENIKHRLKQMLRERFRIDHTTLELEWPEHAQGEFCGPEGCVRVEAPPAPEDQER